MSGTRFTIVKEVWLAAASAVLRWRARLSGTRTGLVLVYHRVGGEGGNEDLEILPAVAQTEFERQLHHLRRHYRVVAAGSVVEAASSRRRGRRFPVAITFDDDLASHARDAFPALRQAGLEATFFLCGASLHRPHSFWWEDLQRVIDERLLVDGLPHLLSADIRPALDRRPRAILDLAGSIVRLDPGPRQDVADALQALVGTPSADRGLRASDARNLVEAGDTVGFHTRRHDALTGLTDAELEDALRRGRDELAAATGARLDIIAYPHGKADARVAAASRKAGFVCGFTTARGLVAPDTDPLLIPRTVADLSARALSVRLARLFADARSASTRPVSFAALNASHSEPQHGLPAADVDSVLRESDRLRREARELRERVAALESSRWWRLHPRFALQRLRGAAPTTEEWDQEQDSSPHLPIDFDEADTELCRRVAPYTMTTPPRIYALARAVEYVVARPVEGAIVECGVWRGGSMMAVALTLLRLGVTDRDLYLFDTFAGMTEPGDEDVRVGGQRAADLLERSDRDSDVWAIAPLEDVREAVLGVGYPEDRVHFVQGRVEDTLPQHAPDRIALLRLDTDWYASTKHELEHLYPRLEHSGVVVVDDYGLWQGSRRAVDEYVRENDLTLLVNRIDHTARIALKP
jgi:peptidoglycan/xylan/chitin deacetylase (PgdA/CDA1 family)